MSYGAQIKFGLARQASAGAKATDPGSFHPIPLLNESVGLDVAEVISQNLNGTFNQGGSFPGITKINGTIQCDATPRNLGALLNAVVTNSPTLTPSGTGLTTYLFVPQVTDFSSTLVKAPWTIYKQFSDANSAELYWDAQFDQLEFAFTQGQFMKVSAMVAGATREPNGIGSMNVMPAGTDIGALFPWNISSLSYAGAGMSNFSDITVKFNDNVDPLYTLNAGLAPFKYARTGFREVTVDGTFYMSDRTFMNNFSANSYGRLLITAANTSTACQSGYYNSLLIDIPQCRITAFKPGASGPGEVSVKVSMRGIVDPASNYVAQFTLQNTWRQGY
jgi:hypothetical protein